MRNPPKLIARIPHLAKGLLLILKKSSDEIVLDGFKIMRGYGDFFTINSGFCPVADLHLNGDFYELDVWKEHLVPVEWLKKHHAELLNQPPVWVPSKKVERHEGVHPAAGV